MSDQIVPFEIHPTSGMPIYRQLIDQVIALIAGGSLSEGDLLPSVRQVAQAAAVNPMTVSKAYSRLEADGVVERVRGRGMRVVKPSVSGTPTQRQEQFRLLADLALHRANQLGLSKQEIRSILDELVNKVTDPHNSQDTTNITSQAKQ